MHDNMQGKTLSSDWLPESTAVLNKFVTRVQITKGAAKGQYQLAPAWQWGDLARERVRLLTTARAAKMLIRNWVENAVALC